MAAILIVLFASAAGSSLRMRGLGTNLAGIVDDSVSDVTAYLQRNCLSSDWRGGLEVRQDSCYPLYCVSRGPFSAGVVTEPRLGNSVDWQLRMTLPVSFRAGGLAWGIAPTFPCRLRVLTSVEGESGYTRLYYDDYRLNGRAGMLWRTGKWAVDLNYELGRSRQSTYTVSQGDTWFESVEGYVYQQPEVRLTFGTGKAVLRALAQYRDVVEPCSLHIGGDKWDLLNDTVRLVNLVGGVVLRPAGQFLVAAAIRYRYLNRVNTYWTYNVGVPVGVEYGAGPITVRLGAEVYTANSYDRFLFARQVTFGFSVRPLPGLTLDFAPTIDSLTNLSGWEFGARYLF